jgi:hypothetical protein
VNCAYSASNFSNPCPELAFYSISPGPSTIRLYILFWTDAFRPFVLWFCA